MPMGGEANPTDLAFGAQLSHFPFSGRGSEVVDVLAKVLWLRIPYRQAAQRGV